MSPGVVYAMDIWQGRKETDIPSVDQACDHDLKGPSTCLVSPTSPSHSTPVKIILILDSSRPTSIFTIPIALFILGSLL